MAKIVLDNVVSGYDLSKINVNFQRIAEQINNNILFRQVGVGETNSLLQNLDANGNRIYNLPDPVLDGDAVPYGWLLLQPDNAAVSAVAAAQSAADSLASANDSAQSAQDAEDAAAIIVNWEYKGQWTTATQYYTNNIVEGTGSYIGWGLIALQDHVSSGVDIDADFLAGNWGILVRRGPSGPGSGDMLAANNLSDVASPSVSRSNLGATVVGDAVFTAASPNAAQQALDLEVGVDVQAFDADTAKTDVSQNFTAPQRSEPLSDNDLTFDLSAKQNFTATPTGAAVLTFTNIPSGLNGNITLVNGSNYAISKASHVKCNASFLATISATGTYWISYSTVGSDVYVSTSGAMS